jgi:hypothetical protein
MGQKNVIDQKLTWQLVAFHAMGFVQLWTVVHLQAQVFGSLVAPVGHELVHTRAVVVFAGLEAVAGLVGVDPEAFVVMSGALVAVSEGLVFVTPEPLVWVISEPLVVMSDPLVEAGGAVLVTVVSDPLVSVVWDPFVEVISAALVGFDSKPLVVVPLGALDADPLVMVESKPFCVVFESKDDPLVDVPPTLEPLVVVVDALGVASFVAVAAFCAMTAFFGKKIWIWKNEKLLMKIKIY